MLHVPTWLTALVDTRSAWAPVAARLALAVAIFPHGAQKLLGWYGGKGVEATIAFFAPVLPAPLVVLVILAESVGALLVLAGLLTRFAAASIGAVMVGAVALFHRGHFFMTWYGEPRPEGFEYHLLALGLVAVLVVTGGGRLSVDAALAERIRSGGPPLGERGPSTRERLLS